MNDLDVFNYKCDGQISLFYEDEKGRKVGALMLDKLRSQIGDDANRIYLGKIVDGIEQLVREDEELVILLESTTRTLDECWKYIVEKARKEQKNGCSCIEENVVYGWAVGFFKPSEEKYKRLNEKPKVIKINKQKVEVKKVASEDDQEEISEDDQEEDIEDDPQPIKMPKRDVVPPAAKMKAKPDTSLDGQVSLFDFMGD